MGSKDITEKNLEALNDVFADIVNVLLFKGARLVNEKDLETDTARSMFKADGKVHEQERDVSKFWKNRLLSQALPQARRLGCFVPVAPMLACLSAKED